MRIRVSGSTSATKSLSSSVSVILSWIESSGVKWYEWASTIKVWFAKQMTLNAEVSFDTLCKELDLLGVSFGGLITYFERRVATGAFWFEEICYLTPWFFLSDSKLMELQNFSQLIIVDSWFILVLISFCNLLMVDLMLGCCVLLYSRLSLRFSFVRSRMAWLIRDLGSLQLYTLGVDVSTAFMSLSPNTVDCKFLQFVLSGYVSVNSDCLSVCCVAGHRLFCQIGNVVQ